MCRMRIIGTLLHIQSALCIAAAVVLASCSVKYAEGEQSAEEETPEFMFSDAKMQRIEEGEVKVALKASAIEQYKDGNSNFARNVEFSTMTGEEVNAEGRCELLCADTDKEEYILFGGISLSNKEHGFDITADSLKWDGKAKQLNGTVNGTMSIRKGGTTISGSAFSASSTNGAFAFEGAVSGEVETEDGYTENDSNGGQ